MPASFVSRFVSRLALLVLARALLPSPPPLSYTDLTAHGSRSKRVAAIRRCPTDAPPRFVMAAFLSTAVIPDSGDSPTPYFLHLAIPFLVAKGLREVIDRGR